MDIFYSSKGGSGCSTTAAAFALLKAKVGPTLLVDLAGEQEAVLGLGSGAVGVWDWLGADDPPPDSLVRLERAVADQLSLLPAGLTGPTIGGRLKLLSRLLSEEKRSVVVDVGTLAASMDELIAVADRDVLVTRACYLSAVKARTLGAPDTVIVIREDGRSLGVSDIAEGVGASNSLEVKWSGRVARAVDAGTTVAQLPRLLSALGVLV